MVYINYIDKSYRDKNLEEKLMITVTGRINRDTVRALNVYTQDSEEIKLSHLQKFLLFSRGYVKVDERIYPKWTGKIPFYIYICHGNLLLDYVHGYKKRLDCF